MRTALRANRVPDSIENAQPIKTRGSRNAVAGSIAVALVLAVGCSRKAETDDMGGTVSDLCAAAVNHDIEAGTPLPVTVGDTARVSFRTSDDNFIGINPVVRSLVDGKRTYVCFGFREDGSDPGAVTHAQAYAVGDHGIKVRVTNTKTTKPVVVTSSTIANLPLYSLDDSPGLDFGPGDSSWNQTDPNKNNNWFIDNVGATAKHRQLDGPTPAVPLTDATHIGQIIKYLYVN